MNFCLYLFNKIFEISAIIIPKSKYNLPLTYEGKKFFSSKLITLTSILIFLLIIWNAVNNINKIGTITNIFYFEDAFE